MADDPKEKPCGRGDELKFGPAIGDGARLVVRHTPDHQQKLGVVRQVREGEALTGNVFTVKPKEGEAGVYHVEDVLIPRASTPIAKPAKVNSREFLSGWDRTFGGKTQPVGQA
jgi:hypothetical protein